MTNANANATATNRLMIFSCALTLAAAWAFSLAASADEKPVLVLHTFAVDMGTPGPARAGMVEIVIERWSTEAERARLRDVLIERGPEKLLTALQDIKPRVGFIRSAGSLGWDLRYAREEVSDATGSHRIIIATDRPMSYWERTTQPRSADYEFTLAEIRIGADGKGEGKLVPAAKVKWNQEQQTIEIENYGTEPVRLNSIKAEIKP